jgi:hypothetical protein
MRCHLNKTKTCKISYTKNKTCCKNAKLGQDWCWAKSKKHNCSLIKQKMKCRLVKGKNETCCINPLKGHWCWSKNTNKNVSRKMKSKCCKK